MEDEVFQIYRSKNILPIVYYNLDGCIAELKDVKRRSLSIVNDQLGVGKNAGQHFCRFWFPNMQEAYTRTSKEVSLRSRFNNDNKLKRAINFCYKHRDGGDNSVMPSDLRRALDLVSGGSIQNFKPMNARAIYEQLCPIFMGGKVLDFSSGYGGRMIGALSSKMGYHYTGIDPNTKTYNGLVALGTLFDEINGASNFEMNHCTSEEFDAEAGSFDAAFSSPPYFNLETYSDEPTQCMNRYDNTTAWFEHYVEPTLRMLHKVLANDALYAVNIADYKIGSDTFEIVEKWKELSIKMNFDFQTEIKMMLNVRPGVGNNKKENGYKHESVFVFRKTS
ncbi:AdoMet_MTases domain containing protein [uncultured Caudovirales phage]|uniref:AdoMet_MTases domain containing protein n=1 Tax=uncultured Caudovirales phage TaxID=2100421 RepID=A0A6J5T9A1_9CAUD|nr:AdoMet_MTases domain containing protein [uncultured Caudovirales phage]